MDRMAIRPWAVASTSSILAPKSSVVSLSAAAPSAPIRATFVLIHCLGFLSSELGVDFSLQYEAHAFFHDRPFLPWHGGVNHVSGTFCKGKIRTVILKDISRRLRIRSIQIVLLNTRGAISLWKFAGFRRIFSFYTQ